MAQGTGHAGQGLLRIGDDARWFGTVTELAGLYVVLSATTNVLPEKLRITKYKAWMRSVLVLWWVVLLLGMATYTRWYVPHFVSK